MATKPSRPLTKDEVLDSLHTMLSCGPRHVLIPRVTQEEGPQGQVRVLLRSSDDQCWQMELKKVDAPKAHAKSKPLRHRREAEDEYDAGLDS